MWIAEAPCLGGSLGRSMEVSLSTCTKPKAGHTQVFLVYLVLHCQWRKIYGSTRFPYHIMRRSKERRLTSKFLDRRSSGYYMKWVSCANNSLTRWLLSQELSGVSGRIWSLQWAPRPRSPTLRNVLAYSPLPTYLFYSGLELPKHRASASLKMACHSL